MNTKTTLASASNYSKWLLAAVAFAAGLGLTGAMADELTFVEVAEGQITNGTFVANNLWLLIAAAMVFIMHLGFSCVESGLTRAKNTTNILFKNVFVVSIGILTYALCGFNIMYPGDFNGYVGFAGFGLGAGFDEGANGPAYADGGYTYWTDFIFQAMFAATCATIVSGAVAERVKLGSFMIFATLFVAISYPITGSWEWGGGWLDAMGFADFAGSSLVHGAGGFAALACVLVLGPRLGKYKEGKVTPILGHSMPLATIGVFLLWFGWYGFNGGSVLSADPAGVSFVFVTTSLAAASGAIGAMFVSWIALKKPDLSMALNGALAGLVGITAGADVIDPLPSVFVGLLAGLIVVISVIALDKLMVDDPVGAISVHGVCGVWGTLCVAIFGGEAAAEAGVTFGVQLLGTFAIGAFSFLFAGILFFILKVTIGVRVSKDEEQEGLDIGEHGQEAYPDFQEAIKG